MNSRVLYVSWNSLNEPLVHSQVLNYLHGLAAKGWRFTLVTPETAGSAQWLATQREALHQRFGVALDWQPAVVPATLARVGTVPKLWQMQRQMKRILKTKPVCLIHARSYLPAWLAARAAKKMAVPWIFDARGFWVDEKVDKGSLSTQGRAYSWLKRQEKLLYRHASGVVMLTRAGMETLRRQHMLPAGQPFRVIPTCVDTHAFVPGEVAFPAAKNTLPKKRLVCVGSVGPGYLGKEVFRLFALAQQNYPEFQCELCTRSDRQRIQRLAEETGVDANRLRVYSASPEQMPEILAAGGIGVSLIEPNTSKQASCPTKVGEYLACGMPVIYNSGIGDMDEVLGDGDVAVRCDDFSRRGLSAALARAVALFESKQSRTRCRALACDYFSLEKGVAAYDELYREVTGRGQSPQKSTQDVS